MTNTIIIPIASLFMIIAILIAMIRLFIGPTLQDRVLAANSIGTKILMLITLIAFSFARPDFILDIVLLYVLLTFTATIAVLKFFLERPKQNNHNTHTKTEEKPQEKYI